MAQLVSVPSVAAIPTLATWTGGSGGDCYRGGLRRGRWHDHQRPLFLGQPPGAALYATVRLGHLHDARDIVALVAPDVGQPCSAGACCPAG